LLRTNDKAAPSVHSPENIFEERQFLQAQGTVSAVKSYKTEVKKAGLNMDLALSSYLEQTVTKPALINYLYCATCLVFVLICAPHSARSAPFCIEMEGVPQQCLYFDTKQCWQDAKKQRARCAVNVAELKNSETDNSICMEDSARQPVCGYQNLESCQGEASKRNAVCFQSTKAVASDDPSRLERTPYR
jgi:hypothetical protein